MFRSDIEDTVWEIMLCVCCGSQVPSFLLWSFCMGSVTSQWCLGPYNAQFCFAFLYCTSGSLNRFLYRWSVWWARLQKSLFFSVRWVELDQTLCKNLKNMCNFLLYPRFIFLCYPHSQTHIWLRTVKNVCLCVLVCVQFFPCAYSFFFIFTYARTPTV